jgi:16S rRNA (uracil1498-N3)-methyltransferase
MNKDNRLYYRLRCKKMSHRFFFPQSQIENSMPIITGTDLNHIKNVLRLKPGDHIFLFDGTGAEYHARLLRLSSNGAVFEVIGKTDSSSESTVHISIGQAYLKEKKMDLLIRQMTELGINHWRPFFSDRTIPAPDQKRVNSRAQRWEKIMIEAVKQCQRNRLVEIGLPVSFKEMLVLANDADIKIIFWENAENTLSQNIFLKEKNQIRSVFSMIGPEGGFSDYEGKQAVEAGFVPVKIGPRILRAETAAVAGCTLLQYLFGDFGEKTLDKNF